MKSREELEKELGLLRERVEKLSQPTLPGMTRAGHPSSRALAKEGMERAERSTERRIPGWSDDALEVIERVARENEIFFADDVHKMAAATGLQKPNDNRAWGGVWVRARRAKICEAREKFVKTKRREAHAMDCPVYHSLIYQGGTND